MWFLQKHFFTSTYPNNTTVFNSTPKQTLNNIMYINIEYIKNNVTIDMKTCIIFPSRQKKIVLHEYKFYQEEKLKNR